LAMIGMDVDTGFYVEGFLCECIISELFL